MSNRVNIAFLPTSNKIHLKIVQTIKLRLSYDLELMLIIMNSDSMYYIESPYLANITKAAKNV